MKIFDFIELIIVLALFIVGSMAYIIATRNRGSFADTPDWSKAVRRIIELICTVACLLLLYPAHQDKLLYIIIFPALGIICGIVFSRLFVKKENGETRPQKRLTEHFINAIILILFILSALLICLITIVKNSHEAVATYYFVVLTILLSAQITFLTYQLYYLSNKKTFSGDETIQIVKICKQLNK